MSRHLLWTGFVLLLAGCLSAPLPVWFEGLDKPRFTRVNLRSTDAVHLRSSNVLEHPDLIPAGSPVERIEITSRWMQLEINKTRCTMYPVGGTFEATEPGGRALLDKYFVDAPDEIDVESLGPAPVVVSIRAGKVLQGMTKELVYIALGPPQWIDASSLPTVRLPRQRILESDRWTYVREILAEVAPIPQKVTYIFADGKLLREE